MTVAFFAAIAGTCLYGIAFLSQGYAAKKLRHRLDLFAHPAYIFGLFCASGAWLASLVALNKLPLFVVQPLLAGSLAVSVILATLILHTPVSKSDVVAVLGIITGLLLVCLSARSCGTHQIPLHFTVVLMIGILVVLGFAVYSYRGGTSTGLASLSGFSFSGAALGARALHLGEGEVWDALLFSPISWVVLIYAMIGAVLYARALEQGPIGPATAALWVVEILVPSLAGVLLLGDGVRTGWGQHAIVGVTLACLACIIFAKSPTQKLVLVDESEESDSSAPTMV